MQDFQLPLTRELSAKLTEGETASNTHSAEMIEYEKHNINKAQRMRKEMTPWERKLWYMFLRDYPIRIQRQKAIGNYIVDFYCAKAKLVLELDGSGHFEPEQQAHDEQRTHDLNTLGVSVLRICNIDVDKNFQGVCEQIDLAITQRLENGHVPYDWKHKER